MSISRSSLSKRSPNICRKQRGMSDSSHLAPHHSTAAAVQRATRRSTDVIRWSNRYMDTAMIYSRTFSCRLSTAHSICVPCTRKDSGCVAKSCAASSAVHSLSSWLEGMGAGVGSRVGDRVPAARACNQHCSVSHNNSIRQGSHRRRQFCILKQATIVLQAGNRKSQISSGVVRHSRRTSRTRASSSISVVCIIHSSASEAVAGQCVLPLNLCKTLPLYT